MQNEHVLKTDPVHFQAVRAGKKTFELRKNDRQIGVGDMLTLEEFDRAAGQYSGEMTHVLVTEAYSLRDLMAAYPDADTLFCIRPLEDEEQVQTRMYELLEDESKPLQQEVQELLRENAALKEALDGKANEAHILKTQLSMAVNNYQNAVYAPHWKNIGPEPAVKCDRCGLLWTLNGFHVHRCEPSKPARDSVIDECIAKLKIGLLGHEHRALVQGVKVLEAMKGGKSVEKI